MAATNAINSATMEEREDLFGGEVKPRGEEQGSSSGCCSKKRWLVITIVIVMLVLYGVGLAIGLAIGLNRDDDSDDMASKAPPVALGAVVSDHEACSDVGRDILRQHGTAVDAAIATMICVGVRVPHSMGIGGGDFMIVYDKNERKAVYYNGRETAPHRMTQHKYDQLGPRGAMMVVYDKSLHQVVAINGHDAAPAGMTRDRYQLLTSRNINARRIGVPGELIAFKMAHNTYGRLPWRDLFQPTIKMIQDGFPLAESSAKALQYLKKMLKERLKVTLKHFSNLCEIFCSDPETGEVKVEGDMIFWPKMAVTLEGIARDGPDYLYASDVTTEIVKEIQDIKGVLDKEDFTVKYKAETGPALSIPIGNYTLYTMGGASGGPVLALIMNILKGYGFSESDIDTVAKKADVYHKIIEAIKFGFADRSNLEDPAYGNVTKLLDKMISEAYANDLRSRITSMTHNVSYYTDATGSYEDTEGTSHLSVVSPYGDAVSITATINWYFGSMEMSNSTGIIWNNEMDDFSKPSKSSVNLVEPGKRPRSSMVPVIVVDKEGKVKLVTGAAGGSRITTSVAQIVAKILLLNEPLKRAVEERRFHHVLFGNQLMLERNFPEDLKMELGKHGHNIMIYAGLYMGVVNSILRNSRGEIEGLADARKAPARTSYMYNYR